MAYITALHIIFVVCWFAGLFYIVRLYVYAYEANLKPEPERSILLNQFQTMKKRLLYGITWPSGILTIIFGSWLLFVYYPSHLITAWFILKLIFVGFLVLYHLQCQIIYKQQSQGIFRFSSMKLRMFNEIATIVLFAVVFLVEIRQNTNWVYAILGTFMLIALILFGIFLYKHQRIKKENEEIENELNPTKEAEVTEKKNDLPPPPPAT
ncbi:MAG: CopD family protein [Bacteroidia bacterium]|nr:CopD family protein [Bacteroidia bacterium]